MGSFGFKSVSLPQSPQMYSVILFCFVLFCFVLFSFFRSQDSMTTVTASNGVFWLQISILATISTNVFSHFVLFCFVLFCFVFFLLFLRFSLVGCFFCLIGKKKFDQTIY